MSLYCLPTISAQFKIQEQNTVQSTLRRSNHNCKYIRLRVKIVEFSKHTGLRQLGSQLQNMQVILITTPVLQQLKIHSMEQVSLSCNTQRVQMEVWSMDLSSLTGWLYQGLLTIYRRSTLTFHPLLPLSMFQHKRLPALLLEWNSLIRKKNTSGWRT